MLYYKCPTCKTILANKQLLYESKLNDICKKTNISEKEKNKEKRNILDQLEIKRICCRMRCLGYVALIDIIK